MADDEYQLFEPDALRTVVEGQPVIDTVVLQETARYEDGYSATHPCIRNFWSIVHRYSDVQKRQLWEFITARDRVPVRGNNNVSFTIMRLGPDSDVSYLSCCLSQFYRLTNYFP